MQFQNLAILQARMNSSRFPGKVMQIINGKPCIYWQIMRILQAKKIDYLIVATTNNPSDDRLVNFLDSTGVPNYRGSEVDVLDRFFGVLLQISARHVLRLTADCPLVMPSLIDAMIDKFASEDLDYMSNALNPTFPDGLDIEIMKASALFKLKTFGLSDLEREHVTLGLYGRPELFKILNYSNDEDLSHERWTLDYPEDFRFVRKVYHHFSGQELTFTMQDVVDFLDKHPSARNSIPADFRNIAIRETEAER